MVHIVWFRQDLRIADNPALYEACRRGKILPVYIYDTYNPKCSEQIGEASRVWLHHSLKSLNRSLQGKLSVFAGNPQDILHYLIKTYAVQSVYWNRCYEPWQITRDTHLKSSLPVPVHSYNGLLLWDPWQVTKADKTPYQVFTPFFNRGCLNAPPPMRPYPVPKTVNILSNTGIKIKHLNLIKNMKWNTQLIEKNWKIGEKNAYKILKSFLCSGLYTYRQGRDIPSIMQTSRLSPHIHFGEISVRTLWHKVSNLPKTPDTHAFLSELGWREFAYNQLFYTPDLPTKNIKSKFDAFPWGNDTHTLQAWQQGKTGVPMVDAGMRELWQTGYMHNRVRMIVGSFLVKNLLIDWRHGERWFWDCLCDADMASNSASWQWVAGCGMDASPYFRIFNPVVQGQKFDPDGTFVRRYIPEIAQLPNTYIHAPWTAPKYILQSANVVLGHTYPQPIVDLKQSRQRALAALQSIKK